MDFIQVNCISEELVPDDFFDSTGPSSTDVDDNWNLFVEITEGDASLPYNCDFDNPLTPSELLASDTARDSCVVVSDYMEKEHPQWWQQFTAGRIEKKSPYPEERYFSSVFEYEE